MTPEITPDHRVLMAVRDRLVEPLGGSPPTEAQGRVYIWSLYPLEPDVDGVEIDIRDADEEMDLEFGYSPEGVNRHLMKLSVVVASQGDNAPIKVKAAMTQTRRLLDWDNQLGGWAERVTLESRSIDQAEDNSRILIGQQVWTLVYYTRVVETQSPFPPHRVLANPQAPFGRDSEDDYHAILGI